MTVIYNRRETCSCDLRSGVTDKLSIINYLSMTKDDRGERSSPVDKQQHHVKVNEYWRDFYWQLNTETPTLIETR